MPWLNLPPFCKQFKVAALAVKHAPSPFNSQSARTLVLFGAHHNKIWDTTLYLPSAKVSAEQLPATQTRINGSETVLFFEDQSIVQSLQEKFPYNEK